MIIRQADCPLQPWKNGLGRTREMAVRASRHGSADFDWRVSVAEVDSAAPFSRFPGVDRCIVLLEGDGFHMTLDDRRVHALTTPFAPFAFPGEAQVTVTLAGGPTRDFNLMLRRDRISGDIRVCMRAGELEPDLDAALVYCARGIIDVAGVGALAAGDAWRCTANDPPLVLHEDAVALVVRVFPPRP